MEQPPMKKIIEMFYDFLKDGLFVTLSLFISFVISWQTIDGTIYKDVFEALAIGTGISSIFLFIATFFFGWLSLHMHQEEDEDNEMTYKYIVEKLREIKPDDPQKNYYAIMKN